MPLDEHYMQYIMGLLEPVKGVKSRAMFGGYGIFHEGDMFALISNSRLYLKANDSNRARFRDAASEQFMAMPYYEVPAEVMEDVPQFREWADISIAVGHATAKKKKK